MNHAEQRRSAGHAQAVARWLVLVNRASGPGSRNSEALYDSIVRAFAPTGRAVDVRLIAPDALADTVHADCGAYAAIIVAGGDGSVSAAAGVLAGTRTALGVLPCGTLNHFARDIGMPIAIEAAVTALAGGVTAQVDVGEVNGRIFVNNSSVGIYTAIVEDRDRQRRDHGRGKWLALTIAGGRALRHYHRRRLTISSGGRIWRRRTSLLFVGNNSYKLHFPYMGARPRLDGGDLCLFAITDRGWRLVRLALFALIGLADTDREFERADGLQEVTVTSADGELPVAIDGEIMWLRAPLRYRIRPMALTVIRPAGAPQDAAS